VESLIGTCPASAFELDVSRPRIPSLRQLNLGVQDLVVVAAAPCVMIPEQIFLRFRPNPKINPNTAITTAACQSLS